MLTRQEIVNFLLSKDIRRLLKRKGSDASETGRALEELRASMFNSFATSEKAKNLQQRLCTPSIALTFNFFVAIAIIFMNKWVLKNAGFQFPVLLSFIHYVVTLALISVLNALSLIPPSPPLKSTPLFTLGLVMSLCTGLANVSLKYNSVGFYQMAKIAVTPTIVLAEYLWYKKKVSFPKVVALAVVSIGVAVATVTDLQFNLFGASVALSWIIPSALSKILWSSLQQRENWTALALMWKTTPISLFCLLIMIPILDPPGAFSYNWNFINTSMIIISGVFGFLLQWSAALALGATSAISHVVLGQFKTCVLLLGNYYIFQSNPGATSICGAFIAIAGMTYYTYLSLEKGKIRSGKQSPRRVDEQEANDVNPDAFNGQPA
ncbi:Nucleotide/sugar transporter family protein isoform 2 [Hibiscus syriacus]|uniref:Nucleotide/sugar transporter family protein isoform 2 n=1 Tax=Hibiscus syriacus TaxID=106335 RepID=A0A6A2WT84_HIBSY|nr:nucleotide-sugar uncharacterized transporter 1-like [Hibiscus syriacus]KAE8657970.1 Nucleotide/sugar transporter family protein isoform 2 [Hibiscus syriacus]